MLVRDLGDAYQLVLQPDHGRLSGQLATAWAEDPALSPPASEGLVLAATRHDDGWAVWERDPRLDEHHRPQSFLNAHLPTLLCSYRACADVVSAESPAAGLLVSMHVSGLQRGRYRVMGGTTTPVSELETDVRAFVAAEEARQQTLMAKLPFGERERWRAYRRLQFLDVLSLYFGLADVERGEDWTLGSAAGAGAPAPDDPSDVAELTIGPGGRPWTARCTPFPFREEPTEARMLRRLVPKREWPDDASFRRDFAAAGVEQVQITITR